MANLLYGKGREKFLSGAIDWSTDDIKVSLVNATTYTVAIDTHEFYTDLSGVVQDSGNLTSKTVTLGVADAADVTFGTVTGAQVDAVVIWKDTRGAGGTLSTSPLIAYIDSAGATLPITPNGGDITVAWDSGANKIFKL